MIDKEKIFSILKEYYGYDTLRNGQYEIINNILNGRDTFCLMPTGGGKSICYQIPALLFEGITLIISPLISLMKDQVDNLIDMGIEAEYINSTQNMNEINSILDSAVNGKYKMIYIAPERLESKIFINKIRKLNVSQIAVDEVHCVSQWGHDFRKSYLEIEKIYSLFKKRPIISAFTATATNEVKKDCIKLLRLKNAYIFNGDINRENLFIDVYKEEDKLECVKDIIKKHEDLSGIVYCSSQKEVDNLYYYLKDIGYSVSKYHGGLKDDEKQKYQESFLYEQADVMIATTAFGMGIDKSNIRFIVHFTIPQNIESYYQEIGRGGRDGERCDCYLFYCQDDLRRVEYIINRSSSLLRREINLRKFQSIIDYCNYDKCYKKYILEYFGNEIGMDYCNNCSNCLNDKEVKDFTKECQMILSTVFRTREKFGISVIVDILKGFKGPKIIQYKLDKITTYSIMKEYSSSFIKDLIKNMLEYGYVSLKDGTYSMLKLNKKSYRILKSEEKMVCKIAAKENVILNPELFEKLKKWRKKKAYIERKKPYILFSDLTLSEISNTLPKSNEELLEIRGVGTKKVDSYGKDILNILSEYKANEN